MFTGIIEEIGAIFSFVKKGKSAALVVECARITEALKEGDSVAVDGVCMTAVTIDKERVSFDLSTETLSRSTAGLYKRGAKVNLERAARLGDRIGGHLVSGHIDGTGKITARKIVGSGIDLEIKIPRDLARYFVEKGSVAVDGISLTVARRRADRVTIALIPYTIESTTLKTKKIGSAVNIECDQIGKYVENFMVRAAAAKMNFS
ncbi:MAG: riboflavin synthase [Nitrospinae bacterium]|nr:riboflavin synthase [Nitrospinota bacterium]